MMNLALFLDVQSLPAANGPPSSLQQHPSITQWTGFVLNFVVSVAYSAFVAELGVVLERLDKQTSSLF